MRTNAVFKRAHNRALQRLGDFPLGSDIGSESAWAEALAVSRTTARAVLRTFAQSRLIRIEGRRKVLKRRPRRQDYFPKDETEQVGEIVEKRFMRWILDGDCKPGQ